MKSKEVKRQAWTEIHGRPPKSGPKRANHLDRYEQHARRRHEDEAIIQGMTQWRPRVKPADKILVTPARPLTKPALRSPSDRELGVTLAQTAAVEHLHRSEQGKQMGVAGALEMALSIIVDELVMTPQEIVKDGEALADLAAYLEAAGMLGLAQPIRDTWNLPEREVFFSRPFMYDRVTWEQKGKK